MNRKNLLNLHNWQRLFDAVSRFFVQGRMCISNLVNKKNRLDSICIWLKEERTVRKRIFRKKKRLKKRSLLTNDNQFNWEQLENLFFNLINRKKIISKGFLKKRSNVLLTRCRCSNLTKNYTRFINHKQSNCLINSYVFW